MSIFFIFNIGLFSVQEKAKGTEGKKLKLLQIKCILKNCLVSVLDYQCFFPETLSENSARLGVSSQSSLYGSGFSAYGVDGLHETYFHTNTQTDPWWKVDLLNVYKVNRVIITNKDSDYYSFRINGAVIRVGNASHAYYSNPM